MGAADLVAQLAGLYEADEKPTLEERVSLWWHGRQDDEVPGWLGLCRMIAPDPAAAALYLFHCAGPNGMRRGHDLATLQSWAYGIAAEAACTGRRARRERMAGYASRWGRQAGVDGCALAMWGKEIRDILPGIHARAEQYGCRSADYLTVRTYAEVEALDLWRNFRADMAQAAKESPDASFRYRWELKTGRAYPYQ